MAAAPRAAQAVALLLLLACLQGCQGGLHGVRPQLTQVRAGTCKLTARPRPCAEPSGFPAAELAAAAHCCAIGVRAALQGARDARRLLQGAGVTGGGSGPSEHPAAFCARQNRLGFFPGEKRRDFEGRVLIRGIRRGDCCTAAWWQHQTTARLGYLKTLAAHPPHRPPTSRSSVQMWAPAAPGSTAAKWWDPTPSAAQPRHSGTTCVQNWACHACGHQCCSGAAAVTCHSRAHCLCMAIQAVSGSF